MWWPWLVAFAMAAVSRAEEEHFLDVKQIVKGTIEAVAKLPIAPQNGSDGEGEKNPEDFYKLFQLPADIMTKLAADAGYIEAPTTTTNGPWIVRRKVHKSSEEQSFTQDESEEEEEEPRRRKKHRKTKDPTLISIRDILSRVGQTTTTPAPVVTLSPAPEQHPPPLRAPNANIASLPVVQSSTDLSRSQVQPQYIYQPIVQPDGKTYYQQVLILPGQVLPGGSVPTLRPTLLHADKSSFVQERPLQPKSIVQADYAMAPPTFPPPVEVFQRASSAAPLILSPRPSVRRKAAEKEQIRILVPPDFQIYPTRYVTPSSQRVQEEPMQGRVQLPMSDPLPVTRQAVEEERESTAVPKESLYTTVLPSEEEQRTSARVFHEEASVPPKQVMKTMQASPLRIRTIDSHVEEASSSETNAIRALKRQEELKKAMERHRLEIEPQPRRRKIRKAKKSKKLLKKSRYTDDDSGAVTVQSNSEEFRTVIRRMPETVRSLHSFSALLAQQRGKRILSLRNFHSAKLN
ncbi:unnamed protein product [Nippostrongylus brasiliensis]|uniref:Proline-rich protein 36-like n=1 Tax=Nippostrongylus brasiliensis TaxID=27835 RepID=A0A0N4YRR3_NIPBR|nr:unnamed protein product [Nippostrongylus brasiliensis]